MIKSHEIIASLFVAKYQVVRAIRCTCEGYLRGRP